MKNLCFSLFLAAIVVGLFSVSALAYDVPIINPDMELHKGLTGQLVDGADGYTAVGGTANADGWRVWAIYSNGSQLRLWNPSPTDRSSGARNQFFDTSWGGVAPEGDQVLAVRTQFYDYEYTGGYDQPDDWGNRQFNVTSTFTYNDTGKTYNIQEDDGGVPDGLGGFTGGTRDFAAAAQQLTEPFDPTAMYVLTAQVGRLAEGTGASYDGSGLNAGLMANGIDTSTRFINDAPALWGGYNVELMAGGITQGGSTWQGIVYGSFADPADDDYIGSIASDNNTLALAQDTWGTSTVAYTPNPATQAAMNALAGKNVVIRLASLEIDGQHQNTTVAAFDDVKLTKFIAGDANMDDDVDVFAIDGSGDAQILSSNLGTAAGATWSQGDFNGDGDVDVFQIDGGGDAQLLSANLGTTLDATAGTAEAIYDAATGELSFDVGTGIAVIGVQAEGLDHAAVDAGSNLGAPAQNGGGILAYFNASGLKAGMADVGAVLPTGLTAEDIGFSFTPIGGESTVVPVTVIVPEPSTIALLLVLGAVALCWRRRVA